MSNTPTADELARKHCVPCEGGVEPLSGDQAKGLLASVEGWELADEGRSIRRKWTAKNFVAGIEFFNSVAELAEKEGHHPDLHLEGYRKVRVEISTHAIGGLSENDFILASKINQIPIKIKG